MKYNNTIIENVKQYTYLGMVFSYSGCVNLARKKISNKGMKALFKLKHLFTPDLYFYMALKFWVFSPHLNLPKIMKTF